MRMRTMLFVSLWCVLAIAAVSVAQGSQQLIPDGLSWSARNNYTGQIASVFKTVSESRTIDQLGFQDIAGDGLSESHQVGIYEDATGELIAQATIEAGTACVLENGWRWADIEGGSVVLKPETNYVLSAQVYDGGEQWGDGMWIELNPYFDDGTYLSARWMNGETFGTMPTDSWDWAGYGAANMRFLAQKASQPSPENNETHVSPDPVLSWQLPEQFPGAVSDFYFGTSSSPPQVGTELTVTTYDPGTLSYMTTYYWKVDVVDGTNVYEGDVWNFTVGGTPTDPVPADGYQHAAIPDMDVSWAGDDWVTSYKVYSGTSIPLTYLGEVTEAQYEGVPTPAESTDYWWQVDEYLGTTMIGSGGPWQMTTGSKYAHWALDETNVGDPNFAISDSYNGYDGLAFDANTVAGGVFGRALELYGRETSYAEVPALNMNTDRATIMCWVRRDGPQLDWAPAVFSRDANTCSGIGFGEAGGDLRYHWNGEHWDFNPGVTVADNCWTHIALVVEPTQGIVYQNAAGAVNEGRHVSDEFDGVTRLGQDWPGRDYKGLIDDVWIYDRPLSASEIAAEYETSDLAKYPDPGNGEIYVALDKVLSWTAGANATAHDVYFGTVSPPPQVATGQTVTTYDPAGDLSLETWYYWRVDEITAGGTVTGNEWTFQSAPQRAYDPSPADGAVEIDPNTVLAWQAGAGGTYTHNVFFGTSSTALDQVATQQTATTYDPYGATDLDWETMYYWRVDERDASTGDLVATGDVWDFTTVVPQCNNPPAGDVTGDCVVDLNDVKAMAENWLVCTIEPAEACMY